MANNITNSTANGGILARTGSSILSGLLTATANIQIGTDAGATINLSNGTSSITGAGQLFKFGNGTLTLSGVNGTGWTGATVVRGGTLALNFSTNDTSKLPDAASLTLGGAGNVTLPGVDDNIAGQSNVFGTAGGTLALVGGTHVEQVVSTTLAHLTTLGRGGSALLAAIFGAALGVEEIQIWTDVDGVLTADPHQVKTARPVPLLSFAEAAELAFFGAKVLHPATMSPAVRAGIPIRVLNTWRPAEGGTRVVGTLAPSERGVKSIATKSHIAAVNVVASEMMFQYGFLERIADAFARHEVVVDVIATSEVSVALTVDASARLEPVVQELGTFSEVSVVPELALVSVVGEELKDGLAIQARIFATLAELGVRHRHRSPR